MLGLSLPQLLPARALDRGLRVLKGAARCLHSTQPPQPVGMLLDGQVQRAVGRAQVAVRLRAVRDPADGDLAEHRRKRTPASALHTPAPHPVAAEHAVLNRPLAQRAEIEMILVDLAEQCARVTPEPRLQLAMLKTGSLRSVSPREVLLKQLPGPLERGLQHRPQQRLHHSPGETNLAGLHHPAGNLRSKGCRDRRSSRPPPWQALDN
jgi:hypothetical protein